MKKSRCIFCMNEKDMPEQVCPVCKKGMWEYQWKENYLEPYAVLHKKYMIGAALGQDGDVVGYAGYDLVLEQKVLVYEYLEEYWRNKQEKRVRNLFGNILSSGMATVKDYFAEDGKGYMITTFPEGETLESYIKEKYKIEEEKAKQMFRPVLRAVNGLHAAGQVHGNITPKHLIVMKDGTLRLLADGKDRVFEDDTDEYKAPEQLDSDGILGPWTDVYAICAVWYEMMTGHKIPKVSDRVKRDRVKKLHWYTKVSAKTEQALIQGISMESQMRFFSIENLLESIELSCEEEKKEMGVIRHIWGDAWLNTARQEKKRKKRNRVKGYFLKRIAVMIICLFCLAGLTAGGIYIYIQTHQPEYFAWKLEKDREEAKDNPGKVFFYKEDSEYKEVKDYLLKYGEKRESEDTISYEVAEEDWDKYPIDQGMKGDFDLDYETAKDVVQYYMKIKDKMDLMDESGSLKGRIEKEDNERIVLSVSKEETYKVRGKNETAIFSYDPLNQRLVKMEYQGSPKRCSTFLEKVLPFLIPETYLTKQECKDITKISLKEGDSISLRPNAKGRISFMHLNDYEDGDSKMYSVAIQPSLYSTIFMYGLDVEDRNDKTQYAGNYERGSDQFQEFVAYVKKHAVSEEKVKEKENGLLDKKGAVQFTLNENDVLKWGEPCNQFRFFIHSDDLIKNLKDKEYRMEKIDEEKVNMIELQKFGAIITDFSIVKYYKMTDDIYLGVKEDLINGDVICLKMYQKNGKNAPMGQEAADIMALIGGFEKSERQHAAKELQKIEQKMKNNGSGGFLWGISEVMNSIEMDKESGLTMMIVPTEMAGYASYYWPQ